MGLDSGFPAYLRQEAPALAAIHPKHANGSTVPAHDSRASGAQPWAAIGVRLDAGWMEVNGMCMLK